MIGDDEMLYRRAPWSGDLEISASAFNDRGEKPSVDRASLRDSPGQTQLIPTDGILTLKTSEVRAIALVINAAAKVEEQKFFGIDVIARPILAGNAENFPENLAHAQVETKPTIEVSSRFKKLKEALALLAQKRGWVIEPKSQA